MRREPLESSARQDCNPGVTLPESIQLMTAHDQKAVWHISLLLQCCYELGGFDWRQLGFESQHQFVAATLVEKLRDWDEGKPDAW